MKQPVKIYDHDIASFFSICFLFLITNLFWFMMFIIAHFNNKIRNNIQRMNIILTLLLLVI